ncbi:zf-HC2 domain-containing protein [Methyloradius palustris]|uniref:Putative zinc-finger domain-containing protein n=1 Tax=Methyloradius palustris TaxID=2778876 RepID=A0A8D5G8W4_9PROT|nr:zf-HC2 domain-containing protein [Methyloradius palustris]BCM25266.1 hypothetical protein ZMTM_15250 [Methyloradius palustris]
MILLSCKQASILVSTSLDRSLSLRERVSLRLHLTICDGCTRFSQQLHAIRVFLRKRVSVIEADTELHLSKDAKIRIAEAIQAHSE